MAPRTKKAKGAKPAALAWKGVSLPSEATAGAGTTDADFWLGLDADDDGFMGLQEIDDVRVVRDGPVVQLLPQASSSKAVAQAPTEEADEEEEEEEEEWRPIGSDSEQEAESGEPAEAVEEAEPSAAAEAAPAADKPMNKRERAKAKAKERQQKLKAERKAAAALARAEASEDEGEDEGKDTEIRADFSVLAENAGFDDFDDSTLPKWRSFGLRAPLKRALHTLGFKQPTSIQSSTLPLSLPGERDVVGIAQTGSGKTLAYGLPILQHVLATLADPTPAAAGASADAELEDARPLAGLFLCPTRELALQVSKHLNALVEAATPPGKKMRFAGIATLTGGMSEEKQRRLLHRGAGADIVVATPGRLWDMCESDDTLTARIKRTRFLVVDEADRMIETGHFAEMEQILALVRRAPSKGKNAAVDVVPTSSITSGGSSMQTLIFSATLSKDLQRNLKRRNRNRKNRGGSTLEDLFDKIDFRDDDPAVVDLTPERRMAAELKETKVECLSKEKDLYLYYFLLRYPGRTIVFINSIDGIRRLLPLLVNLGINAFPLHSQLQQKQRLKYLDRFRSAAIDASAAAQGRSTGTASVLLATDVAARGLDVPGIDHVVHYQLPRSADAFVHRSGRTARAGRSGLSLAMIDPGEKRVWRELCRSLQRPDDTAALPIEYSFLPALRERIELSRSIDNAVHNQAKAAHDESWLKQLADEADIDIGSDLDGGDSDGDGGRRNGGAAGGKSKAARKAKAKVEGLKAELAELLRRPLSARGVSHKYITSGSRAGFVEGLLADEQHESMIGVMRSTAEDDLAKAGQQGKGRKKAAAVAAPAAAGSDASDAESAGDSEPEPEPRAQQGKKRKGAPPAGRGRAKKARAGRP